jgi:hypothetical protein
MTSTDLLMKYHGSAACAKGEASVYRCFGPRIARYSTIANLNAENLKSIVRFVV